MPARKAPKARPVSKVSVRVAEGVVVWHDGRPRYAGHVLDVDEPDARTLLEAGLVEPAKAKRGHRR
jgi:hypothetical protein